MAQIRQKPETNSDFRKCGETTPLLPDAAEEPMKECIKQEFPNAALHSQDSLDVYDIKNENNPEDMEMLEAPQTSRDTDYTLNNCDDTGTYLANEANSEEDPQDTQQGDYTRENSFGKYKQKTAKSKKNSTKHELMELNGTNKVLFSERFFRILEKNNSTPHQIKNCGLIAACQMCGKKLKGSLAVSSNFIRHLKLEHPPKFLDFQALKEENRHTTGRKCHFDRDILDFICNSSFPLSIIKNKSFQKLCPGKSWPSRRSVTQLLEENHSKHIESVIGELNQVEYVCVTADVWSAGGEKSFFGYTCHWLDACTLERKSVALACRRFKGPHSIGRLTEMICEINEQYKLPTEKIVATITDNGCNYIEAFKEFGVELLYESDEESDFDSADSCSDSDDAGSDAEDSTDRAALEFGSISPQLAKHLSCPSQSLNLLATSDFTNIIKSLGQEIQDIHKRSFNWCTQVWNKCSRRKFVKILEKRLNIRLITPCVTRWSSLYDSVKCILQQKTKLTDICLGLGTPNILADEIEYLEEYVTIMKPIAEAIDFLQNEKQMYLGCFLPTIVSVRVKMGRLRHAQFKYLSGVNRKMQEALLTRFEKYLKLMPESWDAVIAAICIPDVKLRFLKPLLETAPTQTEEQIKKMFNSYVVKDGKVTETRTMPETKKHSFFYFGDENDDEEDMGCISTDSTVKETLLYLVEQDLTKNCFKNHPAIRNVFFKYNTPLPSSAPVERLFSYAGIVKRSRRQKMSDKHFEMLVLKKANNT